jgi:hypothetical protein
MCLSAHPTQYDTLRAEQAKARAQAIEDQTGRPPLSPLLAAKKPSAAQRIGLVPAPRQQHP